MVEDTKYKKAPDGERVYLTPNNLSERWGVSKQTLSNWRHTGKGPKFHHGVVPGTRVIYWLTDIEEYEKFIEEGGRQ